MCQLQDIFQGLNLCDYSTLSLSLSLEELSTDGISKFEALDSVFVPFLQVFDTELYDIINVVVEQMVAVFSELEKNLVNFVICVFDKRAE
jgi:hypothetical protein